MSSPGQQYDPAQTLRWIIYNSSENYGIYGLLVLLNQVFRYYRRYREGELRSSRLQTQLTQAQLEALKMQLQPHFLFNTLHSISALLHRDPDAADRMIARLGDFLRLTLENSGAQEVSLQKELEFLTCYLEIERVRFQDRLTTSVEVEPDALDVPVPNLILQPIVENALRHGIAQTRGPGRVEISAKRENGVAAYTGQGQRAGPCGHHKAGRRVKGGSRALEHARATRTALRRRAPLRA